MYSNQALRALVNERLTAAAEEIFALFERTIAEYEEELRRSENENQRKQRLLDVIDPRVVLPKVGPEVYISSSRSGPNVNREIVQIIEIKDEPEEQSVKREEEHQHTFVPESSGALGKEEYPVCQMRQTEHREERQAFSSEQHFLPDADGDTDNSSDWSEVQMRKEIHGDDSYRAQETDYKSVGLQDFALLPKHLSVSETSVTVKDGGASLTREGANWKKHQCSMCTKKFRSKQHLKMHIRVHTGERPYSCVCGKTFNQKCNFVRHERTHTGEKPYSCLLCSKEFTQSSSLKTHMRNHTGEKPYCCIFCGKTFARKNILDKHRRTHTNEKS